MTDFRFPDDTQRQTVIGRTGSGKSQAAVWNLAHRNLQTMPWVVINHKNDHLIDSIEGAEHVDLDFIPKKPGLYVYHPIPEVQDEEVTKLLWRIHQKGRTGIYVDERYMISPRDPAMQAILTQGRSKRIPMIILSQRPVWLSRFSISEADFYQVFHMNDKKDRQTIQGFLPVDLEEWMMSPVNEEPKLKQYHSLWFDVGKNRFFLMKPVPSAGEILDMFIPQLPQKERKKIFL